jgi:hypothetical protein
VGVTRCLLCPYGVVHAWCVGDAPLQMATGPSRSPSPGIRRPRPTIDPENRDRARRAALRAKWRWQPR